MGGLAPPRPHRPGLPSDQSKFNGVLSLGLRPTVTPRAEYMCAFAGHGGAESKETHKIAQEAVL